MIYETNCSTGKVDIREETSKELYQREQDMLAAQPKPDELVTEILAALETSFWSFAKQLSGEPEITQLKLKNWDDKYMLAQHWELNGKPDVIKNPETYHAVIREASKRSDALQNPNLLIVSWLKNSCVWKAVLDWYYFDYEPTERGQAYAAKNKNDTDALQSILNNIESNLITKANEFIKTIKP